MKRLALVFTALSLTAFTACASSSRQGPAESPSQASTPTFPERVRGGEELPVVRRFNRAVEIEHGGELKTRLRVCVNPDGDVASAETVETSGLPEYDRAVADDARTWSYQPFAAPADTRVCQTLEVAYQAG